MHLVNNRNLNHDQSLMSTLSSFNQIWLDAFPGNKMLNITLPVVIDL
jgi:hypothetical protein